MGKRAFAVIYLSVSVAFFAVIILRLLSTGNFTKLFVPHEAESTMEGMFPGQSRFREVYGWSNKLLSPMEIASDGGAIVKEGGGFLEPINYVTFDLDEAGRKIAELDRVCHESGKEFAYISYPSKTDAQTASEYYGIETNQEEIRESFLSRIDSNGIAMLDVRQLLENDGYGKKEIFYKTDHHWKTSAGLYGAKAISAFLNEKFGFMFQEDLLGKDNFTHTIYRDLWLGETGRSLSLTWTGVLDDFEEILPDFDTSLTLGTYLGEDKTEGDFSLLVDESGYSGQNNLYSYSAHYSYKGVNSLDHIHNNYMNEGKILIIKDSFSVNVIPYLSLVASDIVSWDMRTTPDGLYDFIRANDFDVVLLAYTDFWADAMYDFN